MGCSLVPYSEELPVFTTIPTPAFFAANNTWSVPCTEDSRIFSGSLCFRGYAPYEPRWKTTVGFTELITSKTSFLLHRSPIRRSSRDLISSSRQRSESARTSPLTSAPSSRSVRASPAPTKPAMPVMNTFINAPSCYPAVYRCQLYGTLWPCLPHLPSFCLFFGRPTI